MKHEQKDTELTNMKKERIFKRLPARQKIEVTETDAVTSF